MRSFYSLVNLSPNAATGDSVAIGIIFFNGKQYQTHFSDQKWKAAQRLIINNQVDFKTLIRQIIVKCDSLNKDLAEAKLIYSSDKWIDASYFEYLNNYSNGLIQFSAPKIFISSNQSGEFEKLVELFFGKETGGNFIQKEVSLTENVIQQKLISRVSKQVHTNYEFKPIKYPSIHFNFELDCIGKNGSLIGAKSIEFDQSKQTLDLKISHYYSLILMLSSIHHQSIEHNNFYLLSNEPSKIDSQEHRLWESAVTNSLITVLNPEESSKVADKIEEKQATKFLQE